MNEAEVLELKAQLDADYKRRSEAIDIVLEMLHGKNGTSLIPSTPTKPATHRKPRTGENGERVPRVRGLLKATLDILPALPATFTRFDIIEKVEETYPKFKGNIRPDSMRTTLKRLLEDGTLEVVEEASGPKPAIYRYVAK
jgi:hypothetical protein